MTLRGCDDRRFDRLFCSIVVLAALACWWPTRALPVHWDASWVTERARQLHDTRFTQLTEHRADFAHPPLVPALLALAMTLAGDNLVALHVSLMWALPAVVVSTYLLGVQVAGRLVGVVATLLMLAAPVTLEETGQLYLDLPLCAFVTVGVWAWVTQREAVAGLSFAMAAMVKLPGLAVPLTLLVFQVVDLERRRSWRMYVTFTTPFILTAAWFVHHAKETGWILSRPGRVTELAREPSELLVDAAGVGSSFYGAQGRGLLVLFAALAAGALFLRRRGQGASPRPSNELLAVAAVPFVALGAFTVFGEVTQRYGLFVYPCFFIAGLALVSRAARSCSRAVAVRLVTVGGTGVAVLAVELAEMHPKLKIETTFAFRPEEDLGARDMIAVGQRAARWVRASYPDAHVYGSFPESYQLTEPGDGYVDTPMWFGTCDDYVAPSLDRSPDAAAEIVDLVYIHRYAPGQIACKNLSDARRATPLKLFVVNGHWIEVRRL